MQKKQRKFKSALFDYKKSINLAQTKEVDFLKKAIYDKGAMSYILGDFVNAEKDWKLAQKETEYKLRTYEDYCQLWK